MVKPKDYRGGKKMVISPSGPKPCIIKFNYFLTAIKNESIDDLCKTSFLVSSSSFKSLTPVSPKSPFNLNFTYLFFENYQLRIMLL